MGDASRLINAMRQVSKPTENDIVDIVSGEVSAVNPLKIKVGKVELTESFLILGALCKETKIKIPNEKEPSHTHTIPAHSTEPASVGDNGTHTHSIAALVTELGLPEITLWRGLKVGDIVYMLKCGRGQKYFVLQRKEGIE